MHLEKMLYTGRLLAIFFSNVQSFTIATERNRSIQANPDKLIAVERARQKKNTQIFKPFERGRGYQWHEEAKEYSLQ